MSGSRGGVAHGARRQGGSVFQRAPSGLWLPAVRRSAGHGGRAAGARSSSRLGVVVYPPGVAITVDSVSPATGIAAVTAITITGTNFAAGQAVTLGGVAMTSVSYDSATQITATVPLGVAPGLRDLSVAGVTFANAVTVTGWRITFDTQADWSNYFTDMLSPSVGTVTNGFLHRSLIGAVMGRFEGFVLTANCYIEATIAAGIDEPANMQGIQVAGRLNASTNRRLTHTWEWSGSDSPPSSICELDGGGPHTFVALTTPVKFPPEGGDRLRVEFRTNGGATDVIGKINGTQTLSTSTADAQVQAAGKAALVIGFQPSGTPGTKTIRSIEIGNL